MRSLTLALAAGASAGTAISQRSSIVTDVNDIEFGEAMWFVYAGISCCLVLFAGIMSGLTLGLMSLGLVELEILQRSGSNREKKQAAMEALPIYLDKIFHPAVAVVLSVTFVLIFGEVIPQAISARYGLAVGANFVGLVRVLMIVCYPVAYPVGKVLDALIGHGDSLFRRAQLKALVSIHGQEAGKGGELSHDETTIINGALDLTAKTAEEAMTPIESTFSLDVNSKLECRVPVYSGNPKNVIGLLLVCLENQDNFRPETETPVSAVSIRKIPRVPADMPLYDILNEFQKGGSHMAAVVKVKNKEHLPASGNDQKLANGGLQKIAAKKANEYSEVNEPLLPKLEEESDYIVNIDKPSKNVQYTDDVEDGEVIGIITLEDVFEELLQEEIVDETDVYIDVHKRIRVAAAAAASFVARAPSARRLTVSRSTDVG
nr:putative DUF21 domain-containing protein At1g03270 [Tanacetum cinerariifolium]